MQKSLLAAMLGVTLVMPFAAHAEGSYVGVNIGEAKYQDIPVLGGDKSGTVVGLTYGVNINPSFDIELGYLHHGSAKQTVAPVTLKLETQSVYLAAVGKLPVTDGFSVFAKGGVSVNHSKATATDSSDPTLSGSDSNTKAGIIVGVGASYQFTKDWSGIVEYSYFDKPSDGNFKLSNWSVGARYHF